MAGLLTVRRFMALALPLVAKPRQCTSPVLAASVASCSTDAMLAKLAARPLLLALLIGVAAEALFAFHLGRPSRLMFDEVHYVPAARILLALEGPTNVEHPLLGKALIAGGMWLFGDNVIGWRAMQRIQQRARRRTGPASSRAR